VFQGVILDVDGTLVDSNDAHARAWQQAFHEAGYRIPFEGIRRLIGMGGDQLLPEAIGVAASTPSGKAISERRGQIFREHYLPEVKALPGSRDLIVRLRRDGYLLAVASSAQPDELVALLKIAGVDDLFEARTSAGDVEESKPEPDVVVAALRRLEVSAADALMIGDTPYDAEAAGRAGVAFIGFRSGGWSDGDLKGARAVYDGPSDLLAGLDSSPLRRAA
jgi:HAD superfamily hydrolase (TIGR01509 family)